MESTGIPGKEFKNFLDRSGFSCKGEYWDTDYSSIDWNQVENHYQFFFHYVGNEEIELFLQNSKLAQHEFLYTWLSYEDPIIKIKTTEFIEQWEWFYIASIEGMIITSEDGTACLEFTNDYKYHLNSNFEIKPNSKKQ